MSDENKPLVSNASDEKQIAEAKQKVKNRQDQEKDDLKYVLASAQGRRFIYKTLELTGIYKSSFTGSSETFFLEGQRNIGLKLLAKVQEVDFDGYLKMLNEFKGEQHVRSASAK